MIKKAVTHNGSFHADDVFASVVLMKIFPDLKIRRTRDEAEIAAADIVFDVGRIYDPAKLRFDHHQPDALMRENDIPYSAFGLVWREYGEKYCDNNKKIAKRIDEKLIAPIDAEDNGAVVAEKLIPNVAHMTWDEIVSNFEPKLFNDTEGANKQFKTAIEFAHQFLERMVDKEKDELEKIKYVTEMVKKSPDKRYVILDKDAKYLRIEADFPKLLYVVAPNKANGNWGIEAVGTADNRFELKKPLPAEWAGKVGEELAEITGVPDATFAHNSRFFAVAESKKGVLKLLEKTLKD